MVYKTVTESEKENFTLCQHEFIEWIVLKY